MRSLQEPIRWETDIPLLTNRFILWDFLKVAALSVAIMYAVVGLMAWVVDGELLIMPWPVFPGGVLAMLVLFVIASLVLGNRHRAVFEVSDEGVTYEAGTREKRINAGVTVLGAIAGSASTTGAGLLAQSSQEGGYAWSEIHEMRSYPGPRVITLRNSWRAVLRLYVPVELWDRVVAVCERHVAEERALREGVAASRVHRPWWSRVGWLVGCLVLTVCTQAWYWVGYDYEALMRIGVLGGTVTALAAALEGVARRLLGVLGGLLLLAAAWALGASALEPFESMFGHARLTASLDTPLLALAAASTLALLLVAGWRIFGPMYDAPVTRDGAPEDATS